MDESEQQPRDAEARSAADPAAAPSVTAPVLSSVFDAMQASFEQVRHAAREEIARLEAEHEADRARLQAEIEGLRTRSVRQDERLYGLGESLAALLAEYHRELQRQERQADAAGRRRERVEAVLRELGAPVPAVASSEPEPGEPTLRDAPPDASSPRPASPAERAPGHRAIPLPADATQAVPDAPVVDAVAGFARPADPGEGRPEAPSSDDTVQIPLVPTDERRIELSIRGVSSVSAMIRARKAIESLPEIRRIESRHVSDSALHFIVHATVDAAVLAEGLTSIEEPPLHRIDVSGNTIELEL